MENRPLPVGEPSPSGWRTVPFRLENRPLPVGEPSPALGQTSIAWQPRSADRYIEVLRRPSASAARIVEGTVLGAPA
ncbi:protein of unknown function [Micropruina glycogenica]|uniref:Uncharacterized protein n=1 Tax=Micropruina glycogenica TaxID=75385 RepID=A0A2N9JBQ4_9ACTN|nr:protein of unknown function [Micropruina glycogenica]